MSSANAGSRSRSARFTVGESADVGCDLVSELDETPAGFNGKTERVIVHVSDGSVDVLLTR
ncbi:hypothetical protein [Croceicoccus marinus]|uniref:Uncharacterized protein n=1 Tax=Croceicoccus marinus TaxID=450378 RepID=A0A1Z1FBL4_9SPHN|nr:hypothetical protein [Croceicoccus marinus]ARU16142.1 hypothetical protein A9D14_07950 [Croceicoccus marinus]